MARFTYRSGWREAADFFDQEGADAGTRNNSNLFVRWTLAGHAIYSARVLASHLGAFSAKIEFPLPAVGVDAEILFQSAPSDFEKS